MRCATALARPYVALSQYPAASVLTLRSNPVENMLHFCITYRGFALAVAASVRRACAFSLR
jgi:hypothetical protein